MSTLFLPFASLLAGVISFTTPCTLPLIPGYICYVAALPMDELSKGEARKRAFRAGALFVTGFTVVFTLMGLTSAAIGGVVLRSLPELLKVAGVAIIIMGIAMIGLLRLPMVSREARFNMAKIPSGPKGGILLGMAFAFGWVPCIGPILATVLTLAAASRTAVLGAFLLAIYALGMGIPFLAISVGFARARVSLAWLRRHSHKIEILSGLAMIAIGLAFATGIWHSLLLPLEQRLAQIQWAGI